MRHISHAYEAVYQVKV